MTLRVAPGLAPVLALLLAAGCGRTRWTARARAARPALPPGPRDARPRQAPVRPEKAEAERAAPIGWGALFADSFMDSSGECVLATDASGMPTLQARWQEMLDGMGAGDYLFIQFGINDGSATCDRHVGIEAAT